MALATRCPHCQAMFRVVADQLKLRGGLVRCGTCRHVFDAIGSLTYVDDATVAPAPVPPPAGATKSAPTRSVFKPTQPLTPPAPSKVIPKRDTSRPITLRITPSSTSSVFAQSERIEPRLARAAPPPPSPPPASPPPPPPPRPREIREVEPLARATIPAEAGVPTLWMTEDDVIAGVQAAAPEVESGPPKAKAAPAPIAEPSPKPSATHDKRREPKRRQVDKPAPAPVEAPAAKSAATTKQDAAAATAPSRDTASSRSTAENDAEPHAAVEAAPEFLRKPEHAKGFSIVFTAGAALLALIACVQLLVIFRTELVTRWPALRPAVVQACGWMGCTVGWPTRAELLAVVGTELQSVPGTDVLELTAVVRNRANHRVALPAVEVTLTDTQNRPVARKVFAPVDYLSSSGEPSSRIDEGLGAGSDLTVRLVFEARGLSAAGFVVYPFYL